MRRRDGGKATWTIRIWAAAAVWLAAFVISVHAEDGKKALNGVALVIGQSAYENIPALPNPANDAREMAKLLTDLGFDARSVTDRDARKLARDLERFAEDAEGADVAFVYYSGHGIEAGGENWLVPVDADIASLDNARDQFVAVSGLIESLRKTVPVAIVLLDACRTNPFPPGSAVKQTPTGSAEPIADDGLTPVRGARALNTTSPDDKSLGMVVGYAAEPGKPALDGAAGGNSPYAAALLRHLGALPGVEFGAVMRMVTEEVYLDTKSRQRPWVNESLRRFLYFGIQPDEPEGDEGLITGERRSLLLAISDLPAVNRAQVEVAAARDDVPLDSLYGVLRALGTEKIPEDPTELGKVLDKQAERLRAMIGERDALRADDPEIVRLMASADDAIRQGAIRSARTFLDRAVARVEETGDAVDKAEEMVKQKRLADAAVYAQRADAAALGFDYLAAAADYGRAFDLVERWDDRLRWNYKNQEAEAFAAHGAATGDRASLDRAIDAYRAIMELIPRDVRNDDWAITNNNLAVVYQTLGEIDPTTENLQKAADLFRQSLDVLAREKDDINWAAAQNNLGNILLALGQRSGDAVQIGAAVEAHRAALGKRPRDKVPLDWASTQNNIGIALYELGIREVGTERLNEAEAAYRLALEEYTRERTPVEWAMVQGNLGNTLSTLGEKRNDRDKLAESAAAFRAALEVRTRDHFPRSWARTQSNLGAVLNHASKFDIGTGGLESSAQAFRAALEVFTRKDFPLDWATVQNNLGSTLQTLGQRKTDAAILAESAASFRAAARIYTRKSFPLDWAMTRFNLGNTLSIAAAVESNPIRYRESIAAYADALDVYTREAEPRQWALAQAALGAVYHWLSNTETDTASLKSSIAARRRALEVMTEQDMSVDWANAQSGLSMSLLNLGQREQTDRYIAEATTAVEASMRVFTKADYPLQWAFAQNNLGDLHWNAGSLRKSRADYEAAIGCFESAKDGFTASGYTAPIAITDQKIDLVRKAIKALP